MSCAFGKGKRHTANPSLQNNNRESNDDCLEGLGARRKKYPAQSRRSNGVMPTLAESRAKSEERPSVAFSLPTNTQARPAGGGHVSRSKSAEPHRSEYRSAFGWPNAFPRRIAIRPLGQSDMVDSRSLPTKSLTMANISELSLKGESRRGAGMGKTEYRSKFRPFSKYVYVSGSGWKKAKDLQPGQQAHQWYEEVRKLGQQADHFRSRSQFGHPISGIENLEQIYSASTSGSWSQAVESERDLMALSLATTQLVMAEKRAERETASPNKSGKWAS